MKWVGVMPYVYRPYSEACTKTMSNDFSKNVLFVDNTKHNEGIMKSHNRGVAYMKHQEADWLIIISAAIRFGKPGGMDFIEQLEKHPDHYAIHAASDNVVGGKQQSSRSGGKNAVYGWHLTAFHKTVFDNVGTWDCNFSNYGYDDLDLSVRLQKHYKGAPGWDTFPCDVADTTMSHSISLAKKNFQDEPKRLYYQRKWGVEPESNDIDEHYDHPFNDHTKPLDYWPEPSDSLSIQSVELATGRWDKDD